MIILPLQSLGVPTATSVGLPGATKGGGQAPTGTAFIGQKQGVGLSTALESARETALQVICEGNNPPETT